MSNNENAKAVIDIEDLRTLGASEGTGDLEATPEGVNGGVLYAVTSNNLAYAAQTIQINPAAFTASTVMCPW